MSYTNPDVVGYRFPAAAIAAGGVLGRIMSPAGKKGRVIDVTGIVTTDITVAASSLTVGTAADADAYATGSAPISAANAGFNGATPVQGHEIPEDTVVQLASGGESTAGAGDVTVIIAWY